MSCGAEVSYKFGGAVCGLVWSFGRGIGEEVASCGNVGYKSDDDTITDGLDDGA